MLNKNLRRGAVGASAIGMLVLFSVAGYLVAKTTMVKPSDSVIAPSPVETDTNSESDLLPIADSAANEGVDTAKATTVWLCRTSEDPQGPSISKYTIENCDTGVYGDYYDTPGLAIGTCALPSTPGCYSLSPNAVAKIKKHGFLISPDLTKSANEDLRKIIWEKLKP